MSNANKPARKESFLKKFTGMFKKSNKKERERSSSRSPSQGQTNSHASNEGPSSRRTYKNLEDDADGKPTDAGATSVSQTSSVASIDLANVSADANSRGADEPANRIVADYRAKGEANGRKNGPDSSSNFSGPRGDANLEDAGTVVALNEDVCIAEWKTNEAGDKLLVNRLDTNTKINLDTGKMETVETEVSVGERDGEKSASELMKRKWFARERSEDNGVVTVSEKTEVVEESSFVKSGLMEIGNVIPLVVPSVLGEEYVRVKYHGGEFIKKKSEMLIKVEKEEEDDRPENYYYTTGKYASYFLLAIERQYYNPTEVYSMVRYHDSEGLDDDDRKGSELLRLRITIIIRI